MILEYYIKEWDRSLADVVQFTGQEQSKTILVGVEY